MTINKYSSPEEITADHDGWDKRLTLELHIGRFYPHEHVLTGLPQPTLERIIRTFATKAMETL